jgi:hypothetical protein
VLVSQIEGEIKTRQKICSVTELVRFMKKIGDGGNFRVLAAHSASNQTAANVRDGS